MSRDGRSEASGVRPLFTRALIVVVAGGLIAASAAGGFVAAKKIDFTPSRGVEGNSFNEFVLDTAAFSLELPEAPEAEQGRVVDLGGEVDFTAWSITSRDLTLDHAGRLRPVLRMTA